MLVWKLVFSKRASLAEVEQHFSLSDILEMNTIISEQEAEQERQQQRLELERSVRR
jgi:hypothetical protein